MQNGNGYTNLAPVFAQIGEKQFSLRIFDLITSVSRMEIVFTNEECDHKIFFRPTLSQVRKW